MLSPKVPSFNIAAKCKTGAGTPKVRACSEDGQPYVLEGCPSHCASPTKTSEDGYVVLLAISLHFFVRRFLKQNFAECAQLDLLFGAGQGLRSLC